MWGKGQNQGQALSGEKGDSARKGLRVRPAFLLRTESHRHTGMWMRSLRQHACKSRVHGRGTEARDWKPRRASAKRGHLSKRRLCVTSDLPKGQSLWGTTTRTGQNHRGAEWPESCVTLESPAQEHEGTGAAQTTQEISRKGRGKRLLHASDAGGHCKQVQDQ